MDLPSPPQPDSIYDGINRDWGATCKSTRCSKRDLSTVEKAKGRHQKCVPQRHLTRDFCGSIEDSIERSRPHSQTLCWP